MKKKGLLALYFILLVLVLTSMYFLAHFFSEGKILGERDFSQIQKSGILNIVTEYNSVDYYVSGDSIAGLQYELCKYIGKRSGLEVNIHLENNLEKCIEGLEKQKYDIIARNIPITNQNKELVDFTVPITANRQVLVQRKNDSIPLIRNQIDLANKTVYVPQESPNILRLKNLSEEIAEPIYISEIESYASEQLIYMVAYNEIDLAVVDREIALKNAANFPEIDIQTDISFTQMQAWAVRKTAPILLDSLNVWLTEY